MKMISNVCLGPGPPAPEPTYMALLFRFLGLVVEGLKF